MYVENSFADQCLYSKKVDCEWIYVDHVILPSINEKTIANTERILANNFEIRVFWAIFKIICEFMLIVTKAGVFSLDQNLVVLFHCQIVRRRAFRWIQCTINLCQKAMMIIERQLDRYCIIR